MCHFQTVETEGAVSEVFRIVFIYIVFVTVIMIMLCAYFFKIDAKPHEVVSLPHFALR